MRVTLDATPDELASLFAALGRALKAPSDVAALVPSLCDPDTPADEIATLYGRLRPFITADHAHFLRDIEWRYAQARDLEVGLPLAADAVAGSPMVRSRQVTAEDLNTLEHRLTGYTVTANSPGAGSIAWTGLHIVYGGVDYAITDGNTANKYAYWVKATSTTVLQTSNTKPTLGVDDLLVFINNAGTPVVSATSGSSSLPTVVANNAIDAAAIAAGAVGTTALATGAVTSTILATGAVTTTAIASGAVGTTQLATGAVTSTILAAGSVTATRLNILDHVLY